MIFIDTQIWIYAQKEPDVKRFINETDYQNHLQLHKKADLFIRNIIPKNHIGMTYHQIMEIYHSLGFTGNQIDRSFCLEYIQKLLDAKFMKWYNVAREDIKKALILSKEAKIHIWDYICILPMIHELNIIYTCDKHFQHSTFKQFKIPIDNPIGNWEIL